MGRRREREKWLGTAQSYQEDKRREQFRLKLNMLGILVLLIMLLLKFNIAGIGDKVVRWLTGA